jgi:glycosyltransferase involved in cell wall biosynthesis
MPAKKILYVDFYSFLGGGQMNLLSVFAGLDRKRYQPVLALPQEGPFADRARALQVPVFVVPMGKARWRRPWEAYAGYLGLKRLMREQAIDLVHANCYPANKLAGPAARAVGIPCLWHKQIPVTQGKTTGWLWRFFSRYDDRVLAVSRQVEAGLKGLGIPESKVELLYNHADVKALAKIKRLNNAGLKGLGLPTGRPLVGAIGMRRPHKGLDLFLKACVLLASKQPRAHFVLVGDPTPSEQAHEALLQRLSADPPLKGRLHVLPAQKNLAPLLKSLSVIALPSRGEGSPLILLEAMALGVPAVATRPAGAELLEEGKEGWLVDTEDPDMLATALSDCLARPAQARLRAQAARRRAGRQFSREAYLRKLTSVYDGMLKGNQA